MQRFWSFLLDTRTLGVIGLAALLIFLLMGAEALQVALVWAAVAVGVVALVLAGMWLFRRHRARRAALSLEQAVDAQALQSARREKDDPKRAEVAALRARLKEAIKTLKSSRLGQASGAAALYELPWYMIIGSPAAGKSTAVARSGLTFPLAGTGVPVQGVGGTRNCDWFFTTEGILLDTAGRYAVHEEDRGEWRGFLQLLRRHRAKAPINGLILAVSLADFLGRKPEAAIALAKQLRQRVQEITDQLEVIVPVYVVFTKADLVAGFAEFFEDRDRSERERVWGATLAYAGAEPSDAAAQFDTHFQALFDGLKAASVSRMTLHRGEELPPGVLTFPLEFAALRAPLRTFVGTLFEDNPYQFRPVFRGFYFTSAQQEGTSTSRAGERVATRFGLQLRDGVTAKVVSESGFFLKDLFSKVIFADRSLVKQHTRRTKMRWRLAGFAACAVVLSGAVAAWSWAYVGNRQFVGSIQADLDKAVRLQEGRTDLQSRLEALMLVQDRLGQLEQYRKERPWSLSLGLYQGEAIESVLRREYHAGLEALVLKPTALALEGYLGEVHAHADELQPAAAASAPVPVAAAESRARAMPATYSTASPTHVGDAYNALKTYVMLSDRTRMEAGHLSDQVTRFWRVWLEANRGGMPREDLIRAAERIIAFMVAQVGQPGFPQIEPKLAVLDQTRESLRRVVKGMPARERVYAEIRARASTRFPAMTVARIVGEDGKALVAGSHAVSGAFTREAWHQYVSEAIKDAAHKALQSDDWVLKTTVQDDLTLEGSPEQIQKALVGLYKAEYVREWQQFVQGVSVHEFGDFQGAVDHMNRLGDPAASPLGRIVQALHDETSWDNPSLVNERLAKAQTGVLAWLRQALLGGVPSGVDVKVDVAGKPSEIPMGPIGKEFAGLARLIVTRDGAPSMLQNYLHALAKVRSRFNQMKTQGDPGPTSRAWMQETLGGTGELSEALKLVDEQMLNNLGQASRAALRPLLVRPLLEAYAVLVAPAEAEVNRLWRAQVYEPFERTLAAKYPFAGQGSTEATPSEISRIFGADGAIAKFADQGLAGLVTRRGDGVSARTWGDVGLRLRPEFASALQDWVAPTEASAPGGGAGASANAATASQTLFQLRPLPAKGLTEYTVDIDGQALRYRNTAANWQDFAWPSTAGAPGVRVAGTTFDGRSVEFISFPGRFGLEKMIGSADRRAMPDGTFELRWSAQDVAVAIQLRLVSAPGAAGAAGASPGRPIDVGRGLRGLRLPAVVAGEGDVKSLAAAPARGGAQ